MRARLDEQAKYTVAYQHPDYGMGPSRMEQSTALLDSLPRGSYLDVGCGRGEMLAIAERLGYAPVQGVEVVPDLVDGERVVRGEAHDLPFRTAAFDVVSMFDVMEHLLAEDSERVCYELERVASKAVVLTVANYSHNFKGVELHITRRPYEEWDRDFRRWFSGSVEWVRPSRSGSEAWVVRYA